MVWYDRYAWAGVISRSSSNRHAACATDSGMVLRVSTRPIQPGLKLSLISYLNSFVFTKLFSYLIVLRKSHAAAACVNLNHKSQSSNLKLVTAVSKLVSCVTVSTCLYSCTYYRDHCTVNDSFLMELLRADPPIPCNLERWLVKLLRELFTTMVQACAHQSFSLATEHTVAH